MLVRIISTRLVNFARPYIRLAVQRLGIGPVVLAAAALAAAFISWRYRPNNDRDANNDEDENTNPQQQQARNQQRRQQRQRLDNDASTNYGTTISRSSSGFASSSSNARSRKPQWLSRVRRVTIGAVCSQAHPCNLFTIDVVKSSSASSSSSPPTSIANPITNNNNNNTETENENHIESSSSASTKSIPAVYLMPETKTALRQFTSMFEVYLVVRVDTDEMETAVKKAIVDAGLFESGYLDRRKLIFCETDTGRISVARQLESQLHIDESFDVVLGLQRFLQCVAFISADAKAFPKDTLGKNVMLYDSLDGFFSP